MARRGLFWVWFPVIGYAIVIFSFSALPADNLEPPFPWSDKVYHFLEYVPFGALVFRAFLLSKKRALLPALLTSFFVVVLYALSDEAHQIYVPGRSFDLSDLAADTLGGFFGHLPYLLWRK